MKDRQFAVIGLGRFGSSVATTLSSLGYNVLAIDSSEQQVQAIANEVTHAVQVDALDEDALKALGIRNFDVVIVAIGEDIQANILVTVILKEIGVKYVIAKAKNNMHGKVLERVGADKVVYPEKDMGIRVAYHLVSENILDFIELSPDYSIIEVVAPPEFVGKSIGKLNLRAQYGMSVLAIKKKDQIIADPGADSVIDEKDVLVFVGKNTSLSRFSRK
ncbi:MAG: TrkA family potassium uptake protein [Peptococcaceae bacterium]|nr:TrkA family potassium uptake protein [Peptococcaceae bacterium]